MGALIPLWAGPPWTTVWQPVDLPICPPHPPGAWLFFSLNLNSPRIWLRVGINCSSRSMRKCSEAAPLCTHLELWGGGGAHLIGAQAGVCVCSGRGGDVRLTLVAFQHRHHQDEYTAHLHPHSAVSQSKSSLQLYNRDWLYPPPPPTLSAFRETNGSEEKIYQMCPKKISKKK